MAWSWAVLSSPVVSGFVALFLERRAMDRGFAIFAAVLAGIAYLLLANFFVGRPSDFGLVLIAVLFSPFLAVGAVVGDSLARRK